MKPDWKDAPEWARWLTMDIDGTWVWWELEPYYTEGEWLRGCRWKSAAKIYSARDSKESRP